MRNRVRGQGRLSFRAGLIIEAALNQIRAKKMKRANTFMRRRDLLLVVNIVVEKLNTMYRSTPDCEYIHKMPICHRLVAVDGAHLGCFHVTNALSNFGVAEPSRSEGPCRSYHHCFQSALNTLCKMNPLVARRLSESRNHIAASRVEALTGIDFLGGLRST